VKFWFFGGGGSTFVAAAECATEEGARRLALDYNRQPGPLGSVDLIADNPDPDHATVRLTVGKSPDSPEHRDD